MREQLVYDLDRMENICIKLSNREDIWQDRLIYWIAVAIAHIITWILRGESKSTTKS